MKILICTNFFHPHVGGGEIVSLAIAEHMATNHDVKVLTRKCPSRKDKKIGTISIIEYATTSAEIIISEIKKIDPDVIFVYSDLFDHFRHIVTTKFRAKIFIGMCGANWIHQHSMNEQLFKKNLNNVHSLICHSKSERDYPFCNRVAPDKTSVIPNGVFLSEFDTNNLKREDLAPGLEGKIWVVNVSNFFPGKGQANIFPILSKVYENTSFKDKFVYFQIYNNSDMFFAQQLEAQWKQNIDKVKFQTVPLKGLPREKVVGFLKNSNVFLFTSEKEVAPLVLIESMAARLPWVSLDVGNAEELAGGRCVKTFKNNNYKSSFHKIIYDQMAKEVESVALSSKIGEEGRLEVENKYSWDKILPMYEKLFNS
jgi:glycosyltransferase involved in cell wall biosynthesis